MKSNNPRETSILLGASRLGIDPYEYARNLDAGLRWCSYRGHGWTPAEQFGPHMGRASGLDSVCLDCGRTAARLRMRAKRAAKAS